MPQPKKAEWWEISIDNELYFLTQDGYGGEWSETKKKIIKSICQGAVDETLEAERARIVGMLLEEANKVSDGWGDPRRLGAYKALIDAIKSIETKE